MSYENVEMIHIQDCATWYAQIYCSCYPAITHLECPEPKHYLESYPCSSCEELFIRDKIDHIDGGGHWIAIS